MSFVKVGNFSFRYRGLLLPIAIVLLLLPSPHFVDDPALVGVAGLLLASIGQIIRVGTIGLAYIIRGGKDHQVYAEDLVTTGIYAHCRNPMYLGNSFLLAGLAAASNSWLFLLVGVPIAAIAHASIIAAEEDFLRKKFGQAFDAYCQRVPRLLPKLSGLPETFAIMWFNWRRVLMEEYAKPFDWLVALSIITLLNVWRAGGIGSHRVLVTLLMMIIIARLILWALARELKSTSKVEASPSPQKGLVDAEAAWSRAFPYFVLALFSLAVPPAELFGSETLEHLKDIAAVAVALLGLGLRAMLIVRSPLPERGSGHRVSAGEAARAAPSFFLANLLVWLGIFLMHGNIVVMVVGTLLYVVITRTVERSDAAGGRVPERKAGRLHSTPERRSRLVEFILDPTWFVTLVTLGLVEFYEELAEFSPGLVWPYVVLLGLIAASGGILAVFTRAVRSGEIRAQ